MILTNSAKRRLRFEQFFQADLIGKKLVQILLVAEFPKHITARPQAGIAVGLRCFQRGHKQGKHSVYIELAMNEVVLLRRKNQSATTNLIGDLNA